MKVISKKTYKIAKHVSAILLGKTEQFPRTIVNQYSGSLDIDNCFQTGRGITPFKVEIAGPELCNAFLSKNRDLTTKL